MKIAGQSGLALVIVIWVLSLLTIMAGSFALTMRRETAVVATVRDNAVVLAAAETGLTIAQQMLLHPDETQRWRADGSVYQVKFQDAEIRIRLLSEQGKIDINKADEKLLTAMIGSTSLELAEQQALVSAILDWRDHDDLVHINGAEKQQYEDAGLAYQPANKEFQLIDELQMVLGMSTVVFQEIQPLITVFSRQSKVNLSMAPIEVLQVVSDLEPDLLEEYLLQRTENNRAKLLTPGFPRNEDRGGSQVTGNGGVYTVISQARLNGDVGSCIKVTFKKTVNVKEANPFQVLDWQQQYQALSLFSDEMEQLLVTEDESEHND